MNTHAIKYYSGQMDPCRTTPSHRPFLTAILVFLMLGLALLSLKANAVPSFARQTGLRCMMCHTAFPQLTAFGRNFKSNGYTMSSEQTRFPPLAVMLQGFPGFTHTKKDQTPPPGQGTLFNKNDNVAMNQISLFYAGRLLGPYAKDIFGNSVGNVLNKVGVFAQATWDGVTRQASWDNVEFRVAQPMVIAGKSVVLGAYANNNPTMQDLWNSTPAWAYPFNSSGLAPGAAAAPLITDGLGQTVIGVGVYTMIDNQLYLDVGSYKSLSVGKQRAFGVRDPAGAAEIDGQAPYWRIALEKTWGSHNLELGTYGLNAHTFPQHNKTAGRDRFLDVGVDAQYQFVTQGTDVTIAANWINETQNLQASQSLGFASNSSNKLRTSTLTGSYLADKTYGVDAQYFNTSGDQDLLLYGTNSGSPNTNGMTLQINYLPFNKNGGPSFLTSSNVKLSLQYVWYNKFDGEGKNASDNNTLYLSSWIAF